MSEHCFAQPKDAVEFILGGNAYFTLRSRATGTRYTYRVKRAKDRAVYFVSTLYGPDNTSEYSYVGVIEERDFRLTRNSRFTADSPQAKAFWWAWNNLLIGRMRENLEVWHEGRCGCCGRKLTVPESIASGIGPECAKKSFNRPGVSR